MTISMLMSCSDTISTLFGGGEIEQGETVVFNTMVPDIKTTTRSAKSEWETKVKAYKAVNRDYTFNVEMWKQGDASATETSTYKPISTDENGEIEYNENGTLQVAEGMPPLYWQDNVSKWGFKATSVSSTDIEADQSDQDKWLYQDKLVGYSYLPQWTGGDNDGHAVDDFDKINYHTSKEWYAGNKAVSEAAGLMQTSEDYKQIPLYLQHQRSWVTIILKAGEGVTREALAYATSDANIHTTIYSYKEGASTPFEVTKAWSSEALINYDSDKNGDAATGVSTTRYDAIVEPHNFMFSKDTQEKDIIARINVSNQNFTFAANNDLYYNKAVSAGTDTEEAKEAMKAYNLEPGKHLTITATLSRASRMVMITAWIEDWTETVTSTICDDYGQNGDPILIENEAQLIDFLTNADKNKPGNVGLIVPNTLTLSSEWNCSSYDLKATLNLAGAKLNVSKQFLNSIEGTGSLVNGEVSVSDGFNDAAAIASNNHGTIERIRITTSGENTTAKASKAGVVVINHGTVYQCTSALPVYGTTGYVGGIAAQNLYETGTIPVIDACTVTARVDGSADVTAGGGIVGQAEGRVSNNTFEYGMTLLQDHEKFQNIIAAVGTNASGLTMHSNNSWPIEGNYTITGSSVEIVNSYLGQKYNAVIDNQNELKTLLTSTYNQVGRIYRIAGSFPVNKDAGGTNWIWGTDELNLEYFKPGATGTYSSGNVKFKLNGNDKTITLTGNTNATMLFGTIIGEIYDLNLVLDKPMHAARIMEKGNTTVDTNTDAIAALAYDVYGAGKLSNITLKGGNDVYIQSSTPAGIAVWASEGGTLVNCASNVQIRMELSAAGEDGRRYAGGIVASVQKATISQCKYYNSASNAITWADDKAKSSTLYHYGGIVGGTSELADTDTKPLLVLNDCSSWWTLPTFGEAVTVRPAMGSLIGTTRYHENELVKTAMAEGNAGNWWQGTVGAGRLADGITELQAIGVKNSMAPTKPQGW
ncbi:MAG: fimbrillin family protein [Prevotella sp.]|nr:fimbrillin family protein [Prevotella sp.]